LILELRGIAKQWAIARTGERVTALESISLDVAAGEFLIFLGPSGCGKSTLLQIIAGLERPSGGEVRAAARGADGTRRKLTSMVFQLMETRNVFVGVVTFGLLGVVFTWGLQWIERVCCPWAQRS
jgi:ABC-type sugar transport system ATPase subunit